MLKWLGVVLLIVLFVAHVKRNRKPLTAYGTARWAGEADLTESKGLLIGRLSVKNKSFSGIFNPKISSLVACLSFWGKRENPLVRIDPIHCTIVAPTGRGKGVCFVIPHLLTCPESMVIVDFKGENYLKTAKARAKMGHRIIVLDPFHVVTNNPDTFNPLDFIDASNPLAIDDCRALAEALVIRTGQEKEPHWCDAAEMNICAVTSFVVHRPRG